MQQFLSNPTNDKDTYIQYKLELKYKCNKNLSTKLKRQYPDRIPIVVVPYGKINLAKTNFLIDENCRFDQFITNFINFNRLNHTQGYIFYINDKIIKPSELMVSLYDRYKENGFLFVTVATENIFGNLSGW
jgi:hypothetical protein